MADDYPLPLTREEIDEWFPLSRDRPPEDVFELGLVLGGTVSAGAYTAGVLDFLMEALDAWTAARERDPASVPRHRVVISTIGGTSGGAINGGIMLRAAGSSFPHGPDPANPFYNSWTTGVDLMALLSAQPKSDPTGLVSIFDCGAIDKQAERTIAASGTPLGSGSTPGQRSYFGDPLRLFMMVGNVTGIPYRITMRGEAGLSHDLVSHTDYMRFALTVPGGVACAPESRPDELALASNSPVDWDRLQAAAVATSAFPLAFRARPLSRSVDQCRYRAALIPGDRPDTAEVAQLIPLWPTLLNNNPRATKVDFVNVDGGTMNNQPLDIVRMAMAGMNGRSPRDGNGAFRATLLIDPFSDPQTLGPTSPLGLIGMALPLINSWLYQARFKPEDIALAYAEDVFSRFLIAPVGPGPAGAPTIGKAAIAAGGLGGFLDFVDRRFMQYDYRLGRYNAYSFLAKHFAFPPSHTIFRTCWTEDQRKAQVADEAGNIRMIPLMPGIAPPAPTEADWPALTAMPGGLSDAIAQRLQTVYDLAMQEVRPDKWYYRMALSAGAGAVWRLFARNALRDEALSVIEQGLKDQRLLPQAA